jgi:sugar lactone lactonase YvrE
MRLSLQNMRTWQRIVLFVLIFGGGLFALVAITVLLISNTISTRTVSVALTKDVMVKQFVALPDDDAYPAAVAVAPDGTVYTGSYKTGALWKIDTAGSISEVPGSRDAIGAVAGLTVAPDGTVYIVDQDDADPRTSGGEIQRLTPDGTISVFVDEPDATGFTSPDDITVDAAGNVYVSDRGRDTVWRFNRDGSGAVGWWTPPLLDGVESYEPTGLAYDAADNTLLITDGTVNTIYRVSIDGLTSELLYRHGDRPDAPGFDGITITPDGVIYVAALGQNGIARLDGSDLTYIAGQFRGSSDVDYSATNHKLYVTNFDSAALAISALSPRLPFALDEIDLNGG